MPETQHARQLGTDRAGFDDFRVAAVKSELSVPSPTHLKQAAARYLRRQRAVERLHRLGARAVFELLDELARHHPGIAADIDARLARFAQLDPALLRALGGDRFAASPMRVIGGARS
jgi:hypothetical protein